ncbi:site-specific DNA-methyltransferase (adenine-specific) [Gracilibacillus ureilyticus]|uniref:Site-specific DNA-methyltransferase (Adenine-specific) n=1 Tax=Gracilibacillus ureilyticus TaxID=531814 RepID=A0A1H9UCH4_9BACI|nr:class I SAM-dependent methyltransferase [Gracilibacillus ureilyticus]SES07260.1 site-specific DNA-methyltransferase (adenine-specific) [Gracilibacillus ureilyticus]
MEFSVEKAFEQLDSLTIDVQNSHDLTYLEGLAIVMHQMNGGQNEGITDKQKNKINDLAEMMDKEKGTSEQIRKTIQLALIKGMKGSTQPQHTITPDSVAMFIGYFIQKLMENKKQFRLFDPASGSANLLTAVMNQVEADVEGYGSEIDSTLIRLAVESANLQEQSIEFFHQDSLTPLLLEPVDVTIGDLPVGYYPDDVQAMKYELKAEEGHSYSHHLFIEQSLTYTKDGGYLLFLIPNFLFTSDQSEQLHNFLHKHTHIVSLLQLPLSMFASEKHAKSIFILQKKGPDTKAPKQALMAQLPSFKDADKTYHMLRKIDAWFKSESKE